MALVIGMDEAGYGPNLGPLVVTVTAWEVHGDPRTCDFWRCFETVLAQELPQDGRLHVADSKAVYSPARGLANLERAVLCLLRLFDQAPRTFQELRVNLRPQLSPLNPQLSALSPQPWFDGQDLSLPHAGLTDCDGLVERWRECCEQHQIIAHAIRSDVVDPQRFNQLVQTSGSKGLALSRISLKLLRSVWDPDSRQSTLIVADKHGGRNRYDELLHDVLDGQMLFCTEEGRDLSRYRVGATELRFQTRAECHFPVAVASMVSKYVRELSMVLFNRFWSAHLPELKPTAGYPSDARRFKTDIAAVQQRLGIPDEVLWRER